MRSNPKLNYKVTTILVLTLALLLGIAPAIAQDGMEQEISDREITLAIDSELFVARGVSADPIDVETNNGIVILSGTVENILAKERAERVASAIKGVRSVVNDLDVKATARDDTEIVQGVEQALREDPATDSWEIGVVSAEGMVTLTGNVDSWQEKELAATVAKGVKGVREVDNQLDINEIAYRSDDEIHAEVKQSLMWDVRISDALIDVEVDEGRVTLEGTVGSVREKSLAAGEAYVRGVQSVDATGLEVEWWARDEMLRKERFAERSDEDVRRAVLDSFLYDPRVFSFNPEVTVNEGVVTLTGVVDNLKAKRAAAQDAANTIGVWRVKNYLKVRPAEELTDQSVAENVRASLVNDPYVDRFEIAVRVDNGTARLTGNVDSYFEKWQAGDLAASVNGVVDVENRLAVDYDEPVYDAWFYDWDVITSDYDYDVDTVVKKSDWEIRQDIKDELWWSPFVDSDEVEVSVIDGVATLSGEVDSWSERREATVQALEAGAYMVENDLDVEWTPGVPRG